MHYSADVPDREIFSVRFGLRAPEYFGFQTVFPVAARRPAPSTSGGSPDVLWQQQIIGVLYFDETTFIIADTWFDGLRVYRPGERVTVRWFRQPLHPSLDVDTGGNLPFFCPACRTGDTIGVSVAPLVDSHAGPRRLARLVRGHPARDDHGDHPASGSTAGRHC